MPRPPIRIRIDKGRMNLVGECLLQARIRGQITQSELADKIGDITGGAWQPTRDDIYRIESGSRLVSDLEAIAIAAALGKEIEWLIKGSHTELSTEEIAKAVFKSRLDSPEQKS